jgi:hypothetical protein
MRAQRDRSHWLESETGFLALEGGNRRTINCIPIVLNRLFRQVIGPLSRICEPGLLSANWNAVTHGNTIFAIVLTIAQLI